MKTTVKKDSYTYLLPRVLFFTLLSLFVYTVFVFLFTYANAVWYSLFSILFFSFSLSMGLFSTQKEASDAENTGRPKKRSLTVYAPLSGEVIPLSAVKDETFAEGIMGDGCAIIPHDERVYSPVSGLIIAFFETHHAITVLSDEGAEILIHVGKDTVELKGEHFTPLKKAGERVKRGEALLTFDKDAIAARGYDLTTPITVANSSRYSLEITDEKRVIAGDALYTLTEL